MSLRLLGNPAIWNWIEGLAAGTRELHTCILSGPEGIGKKTAALLLAQAMICNGGAKRPCGACAACRKVEKQIHPDIIFCQPDKKTGYSTEHAREIRKDIYIMPNEGKKKIYIFEEADLLLPPAQNALLKVLEEPPAYGVILLLCRQPSKLLETVRSRCVELRLAPVTPEEMEEALGQDGTPEERQAAIAAANGVVGVARQMLAGQDDTVRAVAALGEAVCRSDEWSILRACLERERTSREELARFLAVNTELLADALTIRSGGVGGACPMLRPLAKKLSNTYSVARLSLLYRAARQAFEASALYLSAGDLLCAMASSLYGALAEPIDPFRS